MAPKVSDPREKAVAAGHQLQEALLSASEALKTIAGIVPSLFPKTEGSAAPRYTITTSPDINRTESVIAAPTSNKRKRKEKDPDAPEKPLSAYHLYAKDKREEIKQSMGGLPAANDVIHEINRRWKEMSDDLKKVT